MLAASTRAEWAALQADRRRGDDEAPARAMATAALESATRGGFGYSNVMAARCSRSWADRFTVPVMIPDASIGRTQTDRIGSGVPETLRHGTAPLGRR